MCKTLHLLHAERFSAALICDSGLCRLWNASKRTQNLYRFQLEKNEGKDDTDIEQVANLRQLLQPDLFKCTFFFD